MLSTGRGVGALRPAITFVLVPVGINRSLLVEPELLATECQLFAEPF